MSAASIVAAAYLTVGLAVAAWAWDLIAHGIPRRLTRDARTKDREHVEAEVDLTRMSVQRRPLLAAIALLLIVLLWPAVAIVALLDKGGRS